MSEASDIVPLKLPKSAKVLGALRDGSNVRELMQDMLQIELENGYIIDVGWNPDWNPDGKYTLIVFRGSLDKLDLQFTSRNVDMIKPLIYRLIEKYGAKPKADA